MNRSREESRRVVALLCPDCGGHLEDTWDDDAAECSNCGFAYVRVEKAGSTTSDPYRLVKRTTAGTFAVMIATFSGLALQESEVVTTAKTEAGTAFAMNPDGAFWASVGLGFLALLLISYTASGGVRR